MNDIRSRSGAIFAAMAPAMRAIFSRTPGLQGMYGKTAPFFDGPHRKYSVQVQQALPLDHQKLPLWLSVCFSRPSSHSDPEEQSGHNQQRAAPAFGGRMIRRGPEPAPTIALSPLVDCAGLCAKPQLPRRYYNRARAKALQTSAVAPISADERYNRSPPECRQRL